MCVCVGVCACACVSLFVWFNVCARALVWLSVCVCTCAYVRVYTCVCVCVCVRVCMRAWSQNLETIVSHEENLNPCLSVDSQADFALHRPTSHVTQFSHRKISSLEPPRQPTKDWMI